MKYQHKIANQQGFTLIELMIVIAILAILLAIAVPAYQDYSVRARISEGVNVSASAKLAIAESCQTNTALAAIDNAAVGYVFAADANSLVTNVTAGGTCAAPTITTIVTGAGSTPDPLTITYTGTLAASQIAWDCTTDGTDPGQIPSDCR